MKEFNLKEELKTLKDKRRGQAQQHKIDVVLMITITVRRVLMEIDHKKFGDIFTKWMRHYMRKNKSQWIAVDGKAIKSTKQKEEDKKLAHLVSFFTIDSKEILIARKTASKSNEIPLVQEMMEEFPLQDMIITLDALHCQTKTLKAIKDSGNDYVIQVKDNQKNS